METQQIMCICIKNNCSALHSTSFQNFFIMQTSKNWYSYFTNNLQQRRIDWLLKPAITTEELKPVLKSLQAWQLGETSDGSNLVAACTKYAKKINDPYYVDAMRLFIMEEQKHGENLGRYLDAIGKPKIKKNWGDTLFRKVRHLNTSMQWWTIAVITVESAAQIFYQCLKDASACKLLKQICTDILIDEAPHIQFQKERLQILFEQKCYVNRKLSLAFYEFFFRCTGLLVWLAHRKLFNAGGVDFSMYRRRMMLKYSKIERLLKLQKKQETAGSEIIFYQQPQNFFRALYNSFEGTRHFFRNERNGKIQLTVGVAAIAASAVLHVNATEWLAVLICTGMVISLEMINTSLEQLCNKVETNYNPAIKIVKDVAAGAVLFASFISIIMGVIIFFPKIF